ncbi:MAG: hypothetical protein LBR51_06380, partial [Bacteroidales bacterium]|nr:hypothetical protein [Bacteroidales bacterium]
MLVALGNAQTSLALLSFAQQFYPKRSAGVEIFFKPLVIPLQVCFCGTKEAIDEYLFTCVVFFTRFSTALGIVKTSFASALACT